MDCKTTLTHKNRFMNRHWLILMLSLFLLICSTTWAKEPFLLTPSANSLRLIQGELMQDSLVLVEKTKLEQLTRYAQACRKFSLACQERVNLLEQYAKKSDAVIKRQEEQVYICKEDLQKEKNKKHWIFPVLTVILGGALGAVVF